MKKEMKSGIMPLRYEKEDKWMAEAIVEWMVAHMGSMGRELTVFIVSILPVLELRGGIIAGALMGMNLIPTFVIAYIGNILPIPVVLIFIRKVLEWMRKTPFHSFAQWLEKKADDKKESIEKYAYWGLFLFVAIPLPGTGAWTGALIAALLHMDIKKTFPVICLGVLTAGIIVSTLSFGLLKVLGIG